MKLLEKDMEDLIIENPQKYLDEPDLKLISRQYSIGSYRFDLLFEDRHGAKLIVEIQRGTLDRNHTYKIFDYFDEFKTRNPHEFIELMIVANKITRERRNRLKSHGVSFKEIPESIFLEDLATKRPTPPRTPPLETAIFANGDNGINHKNSHTNIFQKFLNVFSGHEGEVFTRSKIIELICIKFPGTNQSSLIPSDYCYNLYNKGINFKNHIFEQVDQGHYKYLGLNAAYTGKVYWSKSDHPVGEWLNGVLIQDPIPTSTLKHPFIDLIHEFQPQANYLQHLDTKEKIKFIESVHALLSKEGNIERTFNKKEITYAHGSKFGCLVPQKSKIVVGPLLVKFEEIDDPQKKCRDIRGKTYASGGEVRADFKEPYLDPEYAVFLLKQSLAKT